MRHNHLIRVVLTWLSLIILNSQSFSSALVLWHNKALKLSFLISRFSLSLSVLFALRAEILLAWLLLIALPYLARLIWFWPQFMFALRSGQRSTFENRQKRAGSFPVKSRILIKVKLWVLRPPPLHTVPCRIQHEKNDRFFTYLTFLDSFYKHRCLKYLHPSVQRLKWANSGILSWVYWKVFWKMLAIYSRSKNRWGWFSGNI